MARVAGPPPTRSHLHVNAGSHARANTYNHANPVPQSAPDTPASVTAFRNSSSTLTASWPAPAGATSYHITYRSTDVHYWYLAALNHPTNSISINGLDGGKSYIVGVRARNSLGDSGWRNSAPSGLYDPARPTPTPTPTPTQPAQSLYQSAPARPASITLTRTDAALTATWPAVSAADVYNVAYSSDDGDTWLHASYYHPSTSITISGAENSKPYIVGVRGRNSSGYGPWAFLQSHPGLQPGADAHAGAPIRAPVAVVGHRHPQRHEDYSYLGRRQRREQVPDPIRFQGRLGHGYAKQPLHRLHHHRPQN